MTSVIATVITVMLFVIVILIMILKSEWHKRKDAETKAETAQAMWNAATKAMETKQEARHEADEKIADVLGRSGRDEFDAIMRGMQNDTDASASASS